MGCCSLVFFFAHWWIFNFGCLVGSSRKAYRTLGLFWSGSLCANMSVFISGIVAGELGLVLLYPPCPSPRAPLLDDAALIKWTSAPLCPISATVVVTANRTASGRRAADTAHRTQAAVTVFTLHVPPHLNYWWPTFFFQFIIIEIVELLFLLLMCLGGAVLWGKT